MDRNELENKLLELWGADDCYFFEEELCEWFGLDRDGLRAILHRAMEQNPQKFMELNHNRQTMARQNRFERRNHLMGNELMDSLCMWGVHDSSHCGTSNFQNLRFNKTRASEEY